MNPDEKLTRKQRLFLASERLRAHAARCEKCRAHLACSLNDVLWEQAIKASIEVLHYCRGYYREHKKPPVELVDQVMGALRPLLRAESPTRKT